MCVRDMEFTYVYDISIECWNCSVSVIFFSILLEVVNFFYDYDILLIDLNS